MRSSDYDVVVAGGGSAGIAAAIGARQAGARVLLLERNPYFGGQATHSMVQSYCGFCTNGEDWQQVVKGVGQMVLDKLKSMGQFDGFQYSPTGNLLVYQDPEQTKLALDELMEESGADYLLCAQVIDAECGEGRIRGLTCVDDEGRFFVNGKAFVDATGDGNLAALAKAPLAFHCEQSGSLMLRLGNVKPDGDYSPKNMKKAVEAAIADGMTGLSASSGSLSRVRGSGDVMVNIISLSIPGLDAKTLTRVEMEGRRQARLYVEAFRRYLPGMEDCFLVQTGPRVGIRESRRILGEYTLTKEDVESARKAPEVSIARGGWCAELHLGNADVSFACERGAKYFDIPIGALRPRGMINLWCAGRILSSDLVASSSIRVMGTGFATGHAAGVGAALSLDRPNYDVKAIQAEIVRQGGLI